MSGGVDSTVAAYLLKKSGYDVQGVFMKNWDTLEESGRDCQADKEAAEAEKICQHLEIPFTQVNFVKEYWNDVFCPMIQDVQKGETPNPDVDCNRDIKFHHFHRHCLEKLDCEMVATGHYARVHHADDQSFLLQAMDRVKDQTIFLSQISQDSLRKTLFPLGDYTKDVVKKLAASIGLAWVADKKESMGLCFVGKRRDGFQSFVDEYVTPSEGNFVDIDTGQVIGRHDGIHKWTVGQRCKIGGLTKKYYIVDKNVKSQDITVCAGENHPSLLAETFFTHPVHWISGQGPPRELQSVRNRMMECDFRFQNTEPLAKCALTLRMTSSSNWEYLSTSNGLSVSLLEPKRALTVGQYAAFYQGEVCLGSAKIERVGPSLYVMNSKKCRTKILEKVKQEQESGEFKF